MATHLFRTVAATAVAVGALGAAVLGTAGTAGALRSVDDAFLTDITSEGIGFDEPASAISNAHYVCAALDDGVSLPELGADILTNTDLTRRQAAVFVVSAVDNYCPEYTDLFT
ncbi:DUF732 domain-containing protein [Mycolicibacterium sediminis]|uniref:DUF732 domain-containing protein n=1 Tax=Mycolicibacterium sediminis TaxID=1286180 RepID=A0A7I7QYM6_9MYCO|nr:DUF732 domain-containing protein [Mycolicibacterium sediminis]BBY31454.1 hypothetical protein MSEDJ_55500 [Mycolicibacterium sediminis]